MAHKFFTRYKSIERQSKYRLEHFVLNDNLLTSYTTSWTTNFN